MRNDKCYIFQLQVSHSNDHGTTDAEPTVLPEAGDAVLIDDEVHTCKQIMNLNTVVH